MKYGIRKKTFSNDIDTHTLPCEEPVRTLELVALFNEYMPTSVTVSHKGRIFVNFPK